MTTEQTIYEQAHAAGCQAVERVTVNPMIVQERANPLDDQSAITRSYLVNDGVCGFASVLIRPANSKFAKYLVSLNLARKSYLGGVAMSVHYFNQSLTKKEAYGEAFAKVLASNGICAYCESRMD